jgi:hypothetical protein
MPTSITSVVSHNRILPLTAPDNSPDLLEGTIVDWTSLPKGLRIGGLVDPFSTGNTSAMTPQAVVVVHVKSKNLKQSTCLQSLETT